MKFNVRKLLFWFGAILVVLGISGYFLMDYAVDRVLKSIAISTELPAGQPQDSAAGAQQASERPKPSETKPENGASFVSGDGEAASSSMPPSGSPGPSPGADASGEQSKPPAHSPVPSETAQPQGLPAPQPESGQPQAAHKPDITQEKAKDVEEKITLKEKTAVMSTLLKKLNASDINMLKELASGGLSNEEKGEAKKIIMKKLTAEEYNRLIDIAAKYGLSQGGHR